MTGNDEDRIEPKLAETGFFKTVHGAIDIAMAQYFWFFRNTSFDGTSYKLGTSSLSTLYNGVVVPHNVNNLKDPEVKDFNAKWEALNDKYGEGFENGERDVYKSGSYNEQLSREYSERYTLIMIYLNTLGIAQMRQRGEKWEDSEIDFYEDQLK